MRRLKEVVEIGNVVNPHFILNTASRDIVDGNNAGVFTKVRDVEDEEDRVSIRCAVNDGVELYCAGYFGLGMCEQLNGCVVAYWYGQSHNVNTFLEFIDVNFGLQRDTHALLDPVYQNTTPIDMNIFRIQEDTKKLNLPEKKTEKDTNVLVFTCPRCGHQVKLRGVE